MARTSKLLGVALLALACAGCIGRGGNIRGDFACRAPQGTCAPTRVIDAGAAGEKGAEPGVHELATARTRAGVAPGDVARTAERTLRIVFPAHVDAAGTLHDEAVAWAVVETPRWTAELRRSPKERNSVFATLGSRGKSGAAPADLASSVTDLDAAARDDAAAASDTSPFSRSLASPLVLPSTAREAVAGASAPVVEGFDLAPPPQTRTPRPFVSPGLTYPSPEAIAAAQTKRARSDDAERAEPPSENPKEQP